MQQVTLGQYIIAKCILNSKHCSQGLKDLAMERLLNFLQQKGITKCTYPRKQFNIV